MSRKQFTLLLGLVIVVIASIALLQPGQTTRDQIGSGAALLPGLEARVNELDRVTVSGAGNTTLVSLERTDSDWTVAELSSYAADMETVRRVLAGLATAEVIEGKTANPDLYARLGVEGMDGAEASGVRVDLFAGEDQWSIIVGNEAPSRGGYYLRDPASAGSVLANFDERVPAEPSGWVDTRIIDLMAGEVAEVRVVRPWDQGTLTARKVSADETDFTLLELPEGRALKSAWSVNSLGSALSTLDMESVRPESEAYAWDNAFEVRTILFSGLTVDLSMLRLESGDFVRLRASAPFTAAAETAEGESGEAANQALRERVEEINQRVEGWVYKIPSFKADALDKRLEDLLREPEDSSASADGSS